LKLSGLFRRLNINTKCFRIAIQELLYMQPIFSRIDTSKWPKSTLSAVLGIVLLHTTMLAEDSDEIGYLSAPARKGGKESELFPSTQEIHNTPSLKGLEKNKDTYTINFNNVAITEYIRFTSKITNLNFIFNDDELKFNVTIVSEEPVTPSNIVSILIQILRINGLVVLEQDGNLLITRVRNVSQLATVVSSDLPETGSRSPLVTRVFRIKNANLDTVASVIKPMLSDSALLEVSAETKQLIVTDITTNVDKISTLLATIDAPHSPLEVDTYVARNVELQELIKMATQIITPFTEGNPLQFIPQANTGTIFIVSTPYLIERALAVFEDLDSSATDRKDLSSRGLTVFLYALQHKKGDDFLNSIEDLSSQLSKQGASQKLIDCLSSAKWIKESNSILFLADDDTLTKLKDLLPTLDTTASRSSLPSPKSNFFVYKINFADPEHLQNSLDQMAEDLQKAPQPDYNLIDAITSLKYISEAHSLVFTGDAASLAKLSDMLGIFDVTALNNQVPQFLTYNPKYQSAEELKKALLEIISNLKTAGYGDSMLSLTVDSMQVMPGTNSMIFSGSPETLARLNTLLTSLDDAKDNPGSKSFYVYKLQNASGNVVIESLKKISENLKASNASNQAMISTLQDAKWIKDNNSILLTGNPGVLEQVKTLIQEFDVTTSSLPMGSKSSFFIYKPIHVSAEAALNSMKELGQDLASADLADYDLLSSINTMKYVESTQSLLFTGTPDSLEKLKNLVAGIDTLSQTDTQIKQLGEYTFLIYKVQYVPGPQLVLAIKGLTTDLQKTKAISQSEVDAINGLKWIKETNSILFTGPPETLQKIELLVKKFDVPALAPKTAGGPPPVSNFVVYTPRFVPGDELIQILEEFQHNLASAGVTNQSLYETIANLKWVPRTCSLIISGDQDSIARVQDLLKQFDIPSPGAEGNQASIESIQNTSFLIYKLQYHQGSEILSALKQIATDLTPGTAVGNQNLLNAINSLQWVRVTNSLLASGEGDTLSKLRDLIQNIDVPLRQVFIEVLVISTELTNTQNFGLQWGGKMKYLNKFAASAGNFPVNATSSPISGQSLGGADTTGTFQSGIQTAPPNPNSIPFVNGFDLGVIGDIIMHKGKSFINLGSLVSALQTDTDSTILLNPKIITQDNQTSTIFVGNNIPFIGSLVTTNSQIVSSSSNIEYRDIGFNLTVTPTIGNNDVVTLDISNDISQVTNSQSIVQTNVNNNGSQSNINGIETSHTAMSTKVHVPDKHFVVLSGMITDTKARFKSGIPCLGGLPVIGAAFSENDRIASKQNVIIFMRPHIVNTYSDYKEITEHQENIYKNQAVLPVLKEEFDAGVDMVKQAEDE
jgi:type III secretion protein C